MTQAHDVDADEALAAAESIERMAGQYRHMVKAAETLRAIGVAANTLREMNLAIDAARQAKADADEQVAMVNQMIAELHEQAAAIVQAAVAEAKEVSDKAAAIVQAAVKQAKEVSDTAAAEREVSLAKAHALLGQIGEQVSGSRQELEQLASMRSAKAIELEQLESRLQAARAAAAQILAPQ